MAATERIVGSLQQSSSAMGSSTILSIKSLHPSFELGWPYRKQTPSLQASMAGKDEHGATLRKSYEEGSSRSSVSSLLKAVQEGGSNAVMQQVSSIRHFFMPELPSAFITEIKKRMTLSFKEQDGEDDEVQDDLNGGLIGKELEEQLIMMGPRCVWPRQVEEAVLGPRCAWPRSAQAVSSINSSVEQWKQEERLSTTAVEEEARGAKCAWPRAKMRDYEQKPTQRRPQEVRVSNGLGTCRSSVEGLEGLGTSMSSSEALQKQAFSKISREGEGLQNEAVSKSLLQDGGGEEEAMVKRSSTIEGPRCAWPRSTPRRMLATGFGLGLINYVFIGQGAPALAILL
eukprot:c23796_g2_i1 orf=232-1257(-)